MVKENYINNLCSCWWFNNNIFIHNIFFNISLFEPKIFFNEIIFDNSSKSLILFFFISFLIFILGFFDDKFNYSANIKFLIISIINFNNSSIG